MKKMSKVRVPISLNVEQHAILTEAAAAVGLTISAFIRMSALKAVSE